MNLLPKYYSLKHVPALPPPPPKSVGTYIVLKIRFDFFDRSPSPSQQSVCRSPKMGRRALQANGCSTSSPSPTRLHRAVADGVPVPAVGRANPTTVTRPSDLDVRQRRRRNDIVQVESRRVVTVVEDDGDAASYGHDDRGDERYDSRRIGHRFAATSTSAAVADQMDGGSGRLDDTLYELQRLLSNGKLPQRFLEKLVSDDDITDRLLTEFEKLTTAAASHQPVSADHRSPSSLRSAADRRRPAIGPPATSGAAAHQQQHQQHRASSSSSTPEMTSGGRRSVRFDGTASSSADTPASGGRTTNRRRRRDGRNNRSRSRSGGGSARHRPPPPPPPPPPHGNAARDFDLDDDDDDDNSAAEHGCCSTCSSSSGSELDDLSVYQLPARRPYGPGAGAAARISYVPNDAIAYAKQQAGHRSPRGRMRTAAAGQQSAAHHLQRPPPPPPPMQQTMDDKNCAIQ